MYLILYFLGYNKSIMEFKNEWLPENIKPRPKQTELDLRPVIELKDEKVEKKDENDEEIDLSSLSEEEQKKLLEEDPQKYYLLLEEERLKAEEAYQRSIIEGENFSTTLKDLDIDLLELIKLPKKEEDLSEKEILERKEAAQMFHVLDEKSIYKGAYGEWKFIKDNSSVEEWDKLMSGNDNSELYKKGF